MSPASRLILIFAIAAMIGFALHIMYGRPRIERNRPRPMEHPAPDRSYLGPTMIILVLAILIALVLLFA